MGLRLKWRKTSKMNKEVKIFEMFSGYGTATFALKSLGLDHKVVGYSDIDKYANQCFQQNHGGREMGDATKVNPNDLEDFDLLTGGFPCQTFSACGKQMGELDTRGTLFNEIIRIAEVKQPRYMMLENVKGLTFKKHKHTFDEIISELYRIGYFVKWKILNTLEHGVPQSRPRIFFCCFRNWNDFCNYKWPEKEELNLQVKDILEVGVKREQINNIRFERILNSPTGKANPCYELKNDTPSGLSRQNDRIYSTISPCLNCVAEEVLFEIDRDIVKLTPKEHFRLQGFLNDEINLSNLTPRQIKKLAGNGQSLNVVRKIFKNMLSPTYFTGDKNNE